MAETVAVRPPKPDVAALRFVIEVLEKRALRADCPITINLEIEFTAFLQGCGFDALAAADFAQEHRLLVRRKVTNLIGRWRDQGVRSPLAFAVDRDDVVLTWRHERFTMVTGEDPPANDVVEIYRWLAEQTGRSFLLPCLCYLRHMGCDPIFVTDGSRDEGIDCIGRIAAGPLRSTVVFVQAKSTSEAMSGELLLQEYARYAASSRTPRYMQYLEALGVLRSQDGAGYLYAVMLNGDFKYAAQQNAAKLGVLLRSRRQLAHGLACQTPAALATLKAGFAMPPGADLTTNMAPLLGG